MSCATGFISIVDDFLNPDGTEWTGSITYTLTIATTVAGATLIGARQNINVAEGIDICLAPGVYNVVYNQSGQDYPVTAQWTVPPSGGPYTIAELTGGADVIYPGALVVTGVLTVTDTTQSTSISTGCLVLLGGLGVAKSLNVGGDLAVTGDFDVDEIEARNAVVTANATVGGTLGVTGATSLGVLGAGNATVTGTLGVSGQSTLAATSATSLAVSGNGTVGGTLGVTGVTALAGLTATTGGFSSNVTVGGTFGVTGASTLAAMGATTGAFSGAVTMASTLGVTSIVTAPTITAPALTNLNLNGGSTGANVRIGAAADGRILFRPLAPTSSLNVDVIDASLTIGGTFFDDTFLFRSTLIATDAVINNHSAAILGEALVRGTTSTTQYFAGLYGYGRHEGSGVVSKLISVIGSLKTSTSSGGVVTEGSCFEAEMVQEAGTNRFATIRGVLITPFHNQGAAAIPDTLIGIHVQNQQADGVLAVNTYAILTQGDSKCKFEGPAEVGGNLTCTQNVIVTLTDQSTSTTTGSLRTAGGLGVAKNVWCGQTLNFPASASTNAIGIIFDPAGGSIFRLNTNEIQITANFTINGDIKTIAGSVNVGQYDIATAAAPFRNGYLSGQLNSATAKISGLATATTLPYVYPDATGILTRGNLATVASTGSASDLASGTVAAARGGAGTLTGILTGNGAGLVTALTTTGSGTVVALATAPVFVGLSSSGSTQSSSISTGDIVTAGGMGVAKTIYCTQLAFPATGSTSAVGIVLGTSSEAIFRQSAGNIQINCGGSVRIDADVRPVTSAANDLGSTTLRWKAIWGTGTATVGQVTITSPVVPSSASDTGIAGTIAWASGFVYVCVATNTWQRAAIATW